MLGLQPQFTTCYNIEPLRLCEKDRDLRLLLLRGPSFQRGLSPRSEKSSKLTGLKVNLFLSTAFRGRPNHPSRLIELGNGSCFLLHTADLDGGFRNPCHEKLSLSERSSARDSFSRTIRGTFCLTIHSRRARRRFDNFSPTLGLP